MSTMWNNIFFCSLLQYLLLLESYNIRVFWIAAHCMYYMASWVWSRAHWNERHSLINWESMWLQPYWWLWQQNCSFLIYNLHKNLLKTMYLCVHTHAHKCMYFWSSERCTKASISYKKKKKKRETKRWQWHIPEWTPKVGWYRGIFIIVLTD